MEMKIPAGAGKVLQQLNQAGFEAYVVGGCVRDALLGAAPDDWDITTSAKPEEVKGIFRKTIDTGIAHGTVTVRMDGESYEVTTYRIDGEYEDGRHPKDVTFTASLEEDLKRRDFTINAMAYNLQHGLVDLFGGQEDLQAGIVRCVGKAEERFAEDALRMMRAVRFAAKLNFIIEEKTRQAICDHAPELQKVSAERIQVELSKLLTSDHPEKMRDLYETGLSRVFFPEWDAMMACEQNTPHHMYSVGEHSIVVMEHVPGDKVLRYAALLHDSGKPAMKKTDPKGSDHFVGHPEKSDQIAETVLRRLKMDNQTIKKVCALVRYHDQRPVLSERNVRRCMAEMGDVFPELLELRRADVLAQSDYKQQEKLAAVEEFAALRNRIIENGDCTDLKHLAVGGKDLMAENLAKGPALGRMLASLLDAVIDHPEYNTREKLMELSRKMALLCVSLLLTLGVMTGCGDTKKGNVSFRTPGKPVGQVSGDAQESMEALYIIEENNTKREHLTVMNIYSRQEFRYPYSLTTEFLDKYGNVAPSADFQPGMVVRLGERTGSGVLTTVEKSGSVWEWDDLKNYTIDEAHSLMVIGGEKYQLDAMTPFYSKDVPIDPKDLSGDDVLRVVGINNRVLAVAVTTGHGYIELVNTDIFDGTLIEIGDEVITRIDGETTLEVPEGTYPVTVAAKGYGGTKKVKVKRDKTTILDLNQLKGEGPKTCRLGFEISVKGAKIYLDGKRVKATKGLSVTYGAHKLRVEAPGYDVWERTLYVNSAAATISLNIEKEKDKKTKSTQDTMTTNSQKDNTATDSDSSTDSSESKEGSSSSGGISKEDREKAQEDYLTTLSKGIANLFKSD